MVDFAKMLKSKLEFADGTESTVQLTDELRQELEGMSAGAEDISSSFGVLKFRGKEWRFQYGGDDYTFRDKDGHPARSLDVVIVDAAPKHRTYFPPYQPGAKEKPICWSDDLIAPSPAVPEDQVPNNTTSCAACPMNQIGSAVGVGGKKTRACKEGKRVVVMVDPVAMRAVGVDVDAPVKLSMAPTSFKPYKAYVDALDSDLRCKPIQVWTRISFQDSEYPVLSFRPVKRVDNDTLTALIEVRKSDVTRTIIENKFIGSAARQALGKPVEQKKLEFVEDVPSVDTTPKPSALGNYRESKASAQEARGTALTRQPQDLSEAMKGLSPEILEQIRKLGGM